MTPRSKAEDAARKRLARKKKAEAKAIAVNQRDAVDAKREAALSQQIARLKAKLEYDDDPQRGVERVDRAIQWLHDAEAAKGDLATLTRISRELRDTLSSDHIGGVSIIDRDVLRSWNGYAWTSAGDVRRVVMVDLESRGLMKQFEEKLKQEKQEGTK